MNPSESNQRRTIWPGMVEEETGVELDIDQESRDEIQQSLAGFSSIRDTILTQQGEKLGGVFRLLQSRMISRIYSAEGHLNTLDAAMSLEGPNNSELSCESLQTWEPQSCDGASFQRRTYLKIGRTLENIKELRKAYPQEFVLKELENSLSDINPDLKARVLDQEVRHISESEEFATYLRLKNKFMDEWIKVQAESHAVLDKQAFAEEELSATMQALMHQKALIAKSPEVIRYTNYEIFHPFNAQAHSEITSLSLDFWKTEFNRESFLKLISEARKAFEVPAPFFILRFEHSFTYFLCGFPDEHLLKSLEENNDTTPVHGKIIMRQSNQTYRELTSHESMNRTLYHNCLKEALKPYVHQLNKALRINFPKKFLDFFVV